MVGYGDSLRKARRPGWEEAYLDYDGLKEIRNRLEKLLVERDRDLTANLAAESSNTFLREYYDLRDRFVTKLNSEIEKVSLFSLSRLGDLANAVGVLRFVNVSSTNGTESPVVAVDGVRKHMSLDEKMDEDMSDKSKIRFNFDEFGEKACLLPSSNSRNVGSVLRRRSSINTSSTRLFSRSKLVSLVGRQLNDDHDKIEIYSDLGVELLHILKYTCLNSSGIRKITKKYLKLINLFSWVKEVDETKYEDSDFLMPKEVAQRFATVADARIDHLTNNKDFATLSASLLDALGECEKDISGSFRSMTAFSSPLAFSHNAVVKFLIDSNGSPDGLSLLRFECTMSSIHAVMDYSLDASRPFQVFLSRKAMINTGKDQGELGNAEKKALNLLLAFEPDFILDMSESELRQWYRRATTKSRPVGYGKTSSAFIDFSAGETGKKWGGVDSSSMIINLMSTLLYTVNYYIIAPTANQYAELLGTNSAYGATLIGASSFSAIFAAFFYSVWYTRSSFWTALAFSAFCPFIGNLLYSTAISYHSMTVALVGRVICGFGSAEVVNRQLISACVSYQTMTKASALFVSVSAAGMSVGPLIAAILDMSAGRDQNIDLKIHLPGSPAGSGIVFNHTTMPGFLMSFLWGLQFLSVIFLFEEPERINGGVNEKVLSSHDKKYCSIPQGNHEACKEKQFKVSSIWVDSVALIRVIFSNMAFPVTLYLFSFIELSGEVLISSCSMIVHRYFRWPGSKAGFIIASLGALVLPAHFIVERASRLYSERQILKYSIFFVMFSCVAICNLQGLVLDVIGFVLKHIKEKSPLEIRLVALVKNSSNHGEFPYDWGVGSYVYLFFLSAIFIGSIIMEGVNTSLMSKTAPTALNSSFINMGLLATLVGTFGRVVGDSMITICAFLGKSPLRDFVSVTYIPLLPVLGLGLYLLNKNYKQMF